MDEINLLGITMDALLSVNTISGKIKMLSCGFCYKKCN